MKAKTTWPTLEGRLSQPLTSRCEALKQMKANGDILSPLAEKYLQNCLEKDAKKQVNASMM